MRASTIAALTAFSNANWSAEPWLFSTTPLSPTRLAPL